MFLYFVSRGAFDCDGFLLAYGLSLIFLAINDTCCFVLRMFLHLISFLWSVLYLDTILTGVVWRWCCYDWLGGGGGVIFWDKWMRRSRSYS